MNIEKLHIVSRRFRVIETAQLVEPSGAAVGGCSDLPEKEMRESMAEGN
jgi:hypothetical protein